MSCSRSTSWQHSSSKGYCADGIWPALTNRHACIVKLPCYNYLFLVMVVPSSQKYGRSMLLMFLVFLTLAEESVYAVSAHLERIECMVTST
jgi:hypothetical protein